MNTFSTKGSNEMDLHRAKRNAFRRHCNDFRRAIHANLIDLSYELCAAGLIPAEVRDRRAAEEIVCAVENRLGFDESSWDALIEVVRRSDGGAELAHRLTNQLRHGQRPDRGESPAC